LVDHFCQILQIENGVVSMIDGMDTKYPLSVEYGDFGEAYTEVKEQTGQERYNVKIKFIWTEELGEGWKKIIDQFVEYGVLSKNGLKCVSKNMMGVSEFIKITEEEKIAIENDFDPIEAPPGPYKIQPENQGKILWFSGAPGMGKSTTAQIMAREDGHVYYEADCFAQLKNPYIPLDEENPSVAQIKQKSLKGPGMKERHQMSQIATDLFGRLMQGESVDMDEFKKYYKEMGNDIKREKERIGGDFAVAHVILHKEVRDMLRQILGPKLVFICLRMSQEDRKERVRIRHKGDESAVKLMDTFENITEPGQEGEPNTINLTVTANMSKQDVVEAVKNSLKELEDNQIKLLDGHYKVNEYFVKTWKVDGNNFNMRDPHDAIDFKARIEYGDFGAASKKIENMVGKECRYNMRITFSWGITTEDANGESTLMDMFDYGVITDGGNKVFVKGMTIYTVEKITDKELEELENDFDPIEAPPGPYKVQPENQGKILWISGAPGMGKSTSAQLLARNQGYVYYEADSFGGLLNPFNTLFGDNPSMDQAKQKCLKGPGAAERSALVKRANEVWGPLMAGKEYNKELVAEYYTAMCEDIIQQKKRIGGDWAIAHVVFSTEVKNVMRKVLGSKLVFITLKMSSEDKYQRLLNRHEGNEQFTDMLQSFEKIMNLNDEEDEDTIHINVTKDMSREDVVQTILKLVREREEKQKKIDIQ